MVFHSAGRLYRISSCCGFYWYCPSLRIRRFLFLVYSICFPYIGSEVRVIYIGSIAAPSYSFLHNASSSEYLSCFSVPWSLPPSSQKQVRKGEGREFRRHLLWRRGGGPALWWLSSFLGLKPTVNQTCLTLLPFIINQ